MATDDTDPHLPLPDQGDGAAYWLASLCAGRHLEIVGPSRHGPDAVAVIGSLTHHDLELWVVASHPLGATALDHFKDLMPAMAGRLLHPNIVQIYDGGVHEHRPYLLVPRSAGGTLRERIADGPIPVGEAVEVSMALCRAVHFAHDNGFVDLDLSPRQVLLADGRPTMFDLRRSLARRVLQVEGCWIHGDITGCEAPEVLRGEKAGREADVYSLGAILYQMLTGRRTLTRDAAGPIAIREILERDPDRPRTINKRVDRAIESICLRCLAKQPTSRYDSAQSLWDELARWRSKPVLPGLIGWLRRKFPGRAAR
jgi:serine/threonine protein kinase